MPALDLRLLLPVLVGALVLWGLYRRVRRSSGRQRVHPVRLRLRIAVLGLIGVLRHSAGEPNVPGAPAKAAAAPRR
jgi:hypothetical protein